MLLSSEEGERGAESQRREQTETELLQETQVEDWRNIKNKKEALEESVSRSNLRGNTEPVAVTFLSEQVS